VKSGYVVKGCTVRGYWNTAKRIAVQIRYKTGTEVGHVQGEAGAKNWGQRPHFPTIEAAYLIGCTSKGGARYRNRSQDAKTGRNHTPQDPALKPPQKRCKLSGSESPGLCVETPQNAIQAAIS
jgi:hypothetical protein